MTHLRTPSPTNPIVLLLAVLCCAWCTVVFADRGDNNSKDQPDAEAQRWAQLKALIEASPKPESARATFVQERTSLLLDEPIKSEGRFVASGKVSRVSLGRPASIEMRIDDKRIKIYYPDDNVLEDYPLPEQGLPLATGRPDLDRLAQDFTLTAIDADQEGEVWTLSLQAKGKLRKHMQSVSLGFDTKLGLVVKAATVDAAGDRTVMSLKDVEPGAEVTDDELALDVPDDAEVVRPAGGGGGKE